MIPNVNTRPADEVMDAVMKLILDIENFQTIENLYIDLLIIQNFIPSNLLSNTQFITFTHLLSALTMIQNNGFEMPEKAEDEDSDSDEEGENSNEEEGQILVRRASKVDQIDNI